MKKILFFFFCALLLLSGTACKKQNLQNTNQTPLPEETNLDKGDEPVCEIINYRNIKAMWLSQFDLQNIYTNLGKQRAENDFKTKISTILDNVKENGFNTVFLQVRPYADSFYPSSYYPPSKYVTGSYSNSFSYDPIKIIIDEAHKRGLSIHAWINPLRAMNADEIKEIDESFIIKKWYKDNNGTFLVLFNGRYYLNPAY
ncbi:MAG: family 10 glycosylhydrolase, partial [Clostridia bacterium]|nr:family 10 glycosylhydrolase [Clostridia bacterium]